MNTLSATQVQIVTDLLIDNGLIINEAKNNPVIWDHTFSVRIADIIGKCHKLYMDVLTNKVNQELTLNNITAILNKISQYRNEYIEFANQKNTVGYVMYKYINSLFDKTVESFDEFFENLN